ncbi:hypothetical protein LPJ78_003717 [Coemansia sp. RSA 989]|nr:hypothetical protein BX667DRAFT_517922 [Coemansia mojavensis]KAJ1741414.1 hypothetical protein LPJ68_002855 [Coemansia sp. RSA 1086]KAJ1749734.1 hypothetical protein LPJ79_003471 [Coemansia sp. RSA 1821]KAJ1863919.1 hypothetical protein LPJ78_003717 [Coemansia sp. RSA 989]KAJ1871651.1 hypothetical protein LPJ55_003714 [Coemansia sp. RSA 990]KAJ2633624.1 hypothetical protein H4R22_000282 [Coemansia sp. RSA 1290]KAJ2650290.1 hypothetical protein IWW40_002467 [Coemansia sp. RSA 1250]KAJ26756
MPSAEDLQKRVEVLQRQLRKAGDHLKRLATENGTLTDQVEKLTERETQLQAQAQELESTVSEQQSEISRLKSEQRTDTESKADNVGLQQRIGELEGQIDEMRKVESKEEANKWETEANEWAAKLGITVTETAPGPWILQAIREHVDSVLGSAEANDTRTDQLSQEIFQLQIKATQDVESKQQLQTSVAELERKLQTFTDSEAELANTLNKLGEIEKVPDTVSELLRSGLERVRCKLGSLTEQSHAQEEQIAELKSQLEDSKYELDEATQAREELSKDYDLLLERIGTMRDALKAKMNAESEELKRLRAEAAAAKQKLAQRDAETEQQSSDAQKQRKDLVEIRKALWESQETVSTLRYEYQEAAEQHEQQLNEIKARMAAAEEQAELDSRQNMQLEERIEMLQNDLNQALNAESQWVEEREVHLVTIQNLQSALETLQASKDSDVDMAVESLREELRQSTATQREAVARAEQAEARLRRTELSGATAEQCQQKISDQAAEIERLRHEVSVLKDHLNESMRRLREESNEFNLDKRVITNLIVGFLALPYGDSKRYEILQLMSSILQFSEEQQEKVGLIRKAGRRVPVQSGPGTPASETSLANGDTKDSFSDQWISFLLRESSSPRTRQPSS